MAHLRRGHVREELVGRHTVMAHMAMAYIVMVYEVMVYVVMAYIVVADMRIMALCSHGIPAARTCSRRTRRSAAPWRAESNRVPAVDRLWP